VKGAFSLARPPSSAPRSLHRKLQLGPRRDDDVIELSASAGFLSPSVRQRGRSRCGFRFDVFPNSSVVIPKRRPLSLPRRPEPSFQPLGRRSVSLRPPLAARSLRAQPTLPPLPAVERGRVELSALSLNSHFCPLSLAKRLRGTTHSVASTQKYKARVAFPHISCVRRRELIQKGADVCSSSCVLACPGRRRTHRRRTRKNVCSSWAGEKQLASPWTETFNRRRRP